MDDPFINDEHIAFLELASQDQIAYIKEETRRINEFLKDLFAQIGLTLVDFKLEFGIDSSGQILLADEFSPDNCRLWDADGNHLDKDVFRRGLGIDRGLRGRIGKITGSEIRIGRYGKADFVEKKAAFQIKAEALRKELTHNLQLTSLSSLRLVQVYDVFNLEEDLLEQAIKHIFTEQVTDKVLSDEELGLEGAVYFAIEALPGQFDQRAASSQEALLLLGSRQEVRVNTGQLYILNGDVQEEELVAIKNYLLNPVDSRFKDMDAPLVAQEFSVSDTVIPSLDFLIATG